MTEIVIRNARLLATLDDERRELAGGWVAISAGPSERAGFTEVPVSGMPIRCTTVRPIPIANPEKPAEATWLVADSTTGSDIAPFQIDRTRYLLAPGCSRTRPVKIAG